jgi:hypothetical protein
MVFREFLGIEALDPVGTCLFPRLQKGRDIRIGYNGKNGVDVVGHDHKTETMGAMRFEAGL